MSTGVEIATRTANGVRLHQLRIFRCLEIEQVQWPMYINADINKR